MKPIVKPAAHSVDNGNDVLTDILSDDERQVADKQADDYVPSSPEQSSRKLPAAAVPTTSDVKAAVTPAASVAPPPVTAKRSFSDYVTAVGGTAPVVPSLIVSKQETKCLQCPYIAATTRELNDHMARHTKQRPFCACLLCPAVIVSDSEVQRHVKSAHP